LKKKSCSYILKYNPQTEIGNYQIGKRQVIEGAYVEHR